MECALPNKFGWERLPTALGLANTFQVALDSNDNTARTDHKAVDLHFRITEVSENATRECRQLFDQITGIQDPEDISSPPAWNAMHVASICVVDCRPSTPSKCSSTLTSRLIYELEVPNPSVSSKANTCTSTVSFHTGVYSMLTRTHDFHFPGSIREIIQAASKGSFVLTFPSRGNCVLNKFQSPLWRLSQQDAHNHEGQLTTSEPFLQLTLYSSTISSNMSSYCCKLLVRSPFQKSQFGVILPRLREGAPMRAARELINIFCTRNHPNSAYITDYLTSPELSKKA